MVHTDVNELKIIYCKIYFTYRKVHKYAILHKWWERLKSEKEEESKKEGNNQDQRCWRIHSAETVLMNVYSDSSKCNRT